MNENSGDLDSVTGKIALSVTQHRLPRREILDAQPTTSAEHDLVSLFGILGITWIFTGKLFHSPDSGGSTGVKRRNTTLPGCSVREAWVTVTLLSSALMTPRLKSKPKKKLQNKN